VAAPLAPAQIRYIKLGAGGAFARDCFEANEIGLAFNAVPHPPCAAGDWEAVRQILLGEGKTPSVAASHLRELRAFYELGADTLWITFAEGKLWWAFAAPGVIWRGEAQLPRRRKLIGGWRCTDIGGACLAMARLSTRLTKVAAYRATICKVEEEDYLLRKINAEPDPLIAAASRAQAELEAIAQRLIRKLHEKDFEVLVDLIFAASGWRRISVLGETEKDIDLMVEQIATGEKAFVQVKSAATPAVLADYIERYRAYGDVQRFVLACHSPSSALARQADDQPADIALWLTDTLARKAIRAGLFDWLIERVR
jgi:hypothetical protein